jgi:hypothetical protein
MSAYLSDDPKPFEFLFSIDLYFQAFFIISMAFEFRTDFEPSPGENIIKDPIKIALRYINSQFAFDLLAIIPFNFFITIKYGYGRLFYLVKLLRLFKGFQILNVANLMTQIKLIY